LVTENPKHLRSGVSLALDTLLTARRIAANIAKLPEIIRKP
jgi:hypothetical protein